MLKINSDVVVVGGGVAGLWLHNRLNDLGYNTLLIEKEAIGGTQTLCSQGIIHGGVKYSLGGALTGATSAISEMPLRWMSCFQNKGDIDLTATNVLSQNQLMWSNQDLSSKLTSFFSSRVLNGKVSMLEEHGFPELFKNSFFNGSLYQLNEPVIDVPSLVANLGSKWRKRIICGIGGLDFKKNNSGEVTSIVIKDTNIEIAAKQFLLTAGEGNKGLLDSLSIRRPKMQLRPLKMALVKGAGLVDLYAHCIGAGTKPQLTITTHRHLDGENIWYIGGRVAEEGAELSDSELISKVQSALRNALPWVIFENLNWSIHFINRAEPEQSGLLRPDSAFLQSHKNVHVCWPTKLALTPDLADKAINLISGRVGKQSIDNSLEEQLSILDKKYMMRLSPSLWERLF